MIDPADWIWNGEPGHFVGAYSCCFRLHTTVGRYRVSTVGCYHPSGTERSQESVREIGYGRTFETMVFENEQHGEPTRWSELDTEGYYDAEAAREGHMAMCRKWAAA